MSDNEVKLNTTFNLLADYDLSLEDSIKAGRYNYSDRRITGANFPRQPHEHGIKEIEVRLFFFGDQLRLGSRMICLGEQLNSSEEAIGRMAQEKCRPATLRELLFLGKIYPNIQTEFRIFALNAILVLPNGSKDVGVLSSDEDGRNVDLWYLKRFFNGTCLFFGVSDSDN